ncbi:hypothetical protein B5F88_11190 [Flavonifractor sp. An306]|nr:hypothetical protein B5F88_11190 [Flavonifractor sp. An306]
MAIGDMFGDLCKIDILAKSAKPMKCEWKVTFWHERLTDNYLSVSPVRSNIECLLLYLRLIIGEVQESSPEIKALMSKGIISG